LEKFEGIADNCRNLKEKKTEKPSEWRSGVARVSYRGLCLPTSAPFDLATDIVVNWKNIDIFNSICLRLLTRKTEMKIVVRICRKMVSSNHLIHRKDATHSATPSSPHKPEAH